MNYSSSFFWDFNVFYNIMDFCSPPHAGYWIIPQLSWPHRTLWGGLVRFEGTMKFGLKNKRIKLMWRRVQHHPSLERNSNCIDASYRHKTMTCSQTAAFLLGFSACHEDSDMPAPLVVCIGRLSLVLWFIFIYSIIYIYLPWAWYSRVADIDAFTIFPLGNPTI